MKLFIKTTLKLAALFIFLLSNSTKAQNNPDLSKLILNDTAQINTSLRTLVDLSIKNPEASIPLLLEFNEKIINYPFSPAQELNWKFSIHKALMSAYENTGNLQTAILYGDKAIINAEKLRLYSSAQSLRVENGRLYFELGDKIKALDHFYEALNNWDGEIPEEFEALAYFGIAKVHFEQRNYGDADKSLNQALRKNPNESLKGDIYLYLGKIYFENQEFLIALEFMSKSLAINEKLKNDKALAANYFNIANVFLKLGRLNKAESFYKISLDIDSLSNNKEDRSETYAQLMTLKMSQEKLDDALAFGQKAINNLENKNALDLQEIVYLNFSEIYRKRNLLKEAINYYQKYSEILKLKIQRKQNDEINEFRVKYEMEKKERELEELNNQKRLSELAFQQRIADDRKEKNMLFTFGALMFVIILMGAVLLFNFQRQIESNKTINQKTEEINRVKIKELEKSLRLESANAMLKGQEIERNRIAKDLHDSVGALLSSIKLHFESIRGHLKYENGTQIYEKTNQLIDEACYEVRNISHDMMPGSLIRFGLIPALQDYTSKLKSGKKLAVDIIDYGVPERLDDSISLNAYRIVQELLNNVMKHSGAKEVLVQLTVKNNQLNIMVEDDGQGFDVDIARQSGMGLKNIISRVNYLNGEIHFDSEKGKGTNIMIDFPLAS